MARSRTARSYSPRRIVELFPTGCLDVSQSAQPRIIVNIKFYVCVLTPDGHFCNRDSIQNSIFRVIRAVSGQETAGLGKRQVLVGSLPTVKKS